MLDRPTRREASYWGIRRNEPLSPPTQGPAVGVRERGEAGVLGRSVFDERRGLGAPPPLE